MPGTSIHLPNFLTTVFVLVVYPNFRPSPFLPKLFQFVSAKFLTTFFRHLPKHLLQKPGRWRCPQSRKHYDDVLGIFLHVFSKTEQMDAPHTECPWPCTVRTPLCTPLTQCLRNTV